MQYIPFISLESFQTLQNTPLTQKYQHIPSNIHCCGYVYGNYQETHRDPDSILWENPIRIPKGLYGKTIWILIGRADITTYGSIILK